MSQLEEKAIASTQQYLGFVFGRASFPDAFTGDEASHMRDVAWLLRAAVLIAIVSGVLLARIIDTREWASLSKRALVVFAVVGVLALFLPFETIFHTFHLLLFPQGNWTFPADSTLITFYPQSFFAWYAACWLAYAAFTASIIGLFGRLFFR